MTVSIINGSPKRGKSTSELMIQYFCQEMSSKKIVKVYDASRAPLQQSQYEEIINRQEQQSERRACTMNVGQRVLIY